MIVLAMLFFLSSADDTAAKIQAVVNSGRVLQIAVSDSDRVSPPERIAPGLPPLLGFRLLEGRLRHRFGDLDLVLDDAGH